MTEDHQNTCFYRGKRKEEMDEAQDLYHVVMKTEFVDPQKIWVVNIVLK